MSADANTEWMPSTQSRSASVTLAITVVIVLETIGLHLWLRQRHPVLAWALTGLSLAALAWRNLPQAATEYLNAARPEDPNLLLTFPNADRPTHRCWTAPVRQLCLRVASPERAVEHWERWQAKSGTPA